jgi:DNA invertase Pin-like site-specific DNA recombinase
MAPKAAALYARISSDPDGLAAGVTRQIADCRAFAYRRCWPVADVYVDNDTSAYSGRKRPEYERLLDDLATGTRDAVIVYHLDRLHRRPRELEDFLDLCDRTGVRDLACVTGEIDLGTDDGRFHARILGAVARKESDDKSRRLLRKHLELANAGKVSGGGTRPYGYAIDRHTVIPAEAALITEMAERLLAGDSLRSIATNLNDRDVVTVTGRQWTTHSVRQLLYSARVSGQREHHGEIIGKASWPAIIKPANTTRIRALLNDPDRRTNRVARKYLLAGLLRCGSCGTTMVSRPRSDGRGRYVCSRDPGRDGCGGTFILSDEVDAFIADAVVHRLDTPRLAASMRRRATADPAIASVIQALERDQDQLDELAASYGEKQISHREWLAARAPIQARIKSANATLNRGQRTTALAGILDQPEGIAATYDALPLARQQAIVKAVLNYAQIGPAVRGRNRFDPGRISPAWRV